MCVAVIQHNSSPCLATTTFYMQEVVSNLYCIPYFLLAGRKDDDFATVTEPDQGKVEPSPPSIKKKENKLKFCP